MRAALERMPGPVLAYCQGGNRAARLWALAQAGSMPADAILAAGRTAGVDLSALGDHLNAAPHVPQPATGRPGARRFNVVIAGGGAAGLATAASILRRRPGIALAIVDPSATHYYQPGWTMVGGRHLYARTDAPPGRGADSGWGDMDPSARGGLSAGGA